MDWLRFGNLEMTISPWGGEQLQALPRSVHELTGKPGQEQQPQAAGLTGDKA